VLKSLPDGVAAIGNPAKIVGYTTGGNSMANVDSISKLAEANMNAMRQSSRIQLNPATGTIHNNRSDSIDLTTPKIPSSGNLSSSSTSSSTTSTILTSSSTAKTESNVPSSVTFAATTSEMEVSSAVAEDKTEAANADQHPSL